MSLKQEMIVFFGEDELIYASKEKVSKIGFSQKTRDFILNTGFPCIIDYLRFSLDLDALSEDAEIGEYVRNLGQLFTIGCQSPTPFVGRIIHLSEIGLERNASLSDIKQRMSVLGIDPDDDVILSSEVTQACRICINLDKNEEIIAVVPKNLSTFFVNSSIQQLAASLIAYNRNLMVEKDNNRAIEDFQEELENIDSNALDSEKNLWVDIIARLIRDREGY